MFCALSAKKVWENMKSMTGYAKASVTVDNRELNVEIKSVNHRYLDLNIKLPRLFNAYEDTVRKIVSAAVSRGHLDIYVNYFDKQQRTKHIEIDMNMASSLSEAACQISSELDLINDYNVATLMRQPDIINIRYVEDDETVLLQMLTDALKQAVNNLNAMREIEGANLQLDIVSRLESTKQMVNIIKDNSADMIKEYSDKLRERINLALADIKLDEARLANEIAFFVDKSNIDEELARLYSHIQHTYDIISETVPQGRKLDFIVQEFNREANTICSKSNSISVTEVGLRLKNEIEKIREQVQNIE